MIRFLALWLLLFVIGIVAAVPVIVFLTHDLDLRFDAFLISMLSAAAGAILLLAFMPPLRDANRPALAPALRERAVANLATALGIVIAAAAVLRVLRVVPLQIFDWMRAALAIGAAIGFILAWRKPEALAPALLFAILGVTSGKLPIYASHVFESQPLVFRWIVFFGALAIAVFATIIASAIKMRRSAPGAAAVLESSLAPAVIAGTIVIGNVFWRPFLTAGWDLLANVFGAAAMALALVAAVVLVRSSATGKRLS